MLDARRNPTPRARGIDQIANFCCNRGFDRFQTLFLGRTPGGNCIARAKNQQSQLQTKD